MGKRINEWLSKTEAKVKGEVQQGGVLNLPAPVGLEDR
jgi:hypothetical protein